MLLPRFGFACRCALWVGLVAMIGCNRGPSIAVHDYVDLADAIGAIPIAPRLPLGLGPAAQRASTEATAWNRSAGLVGAFCPLFVVERGAGAKCVVWTLIYSSGGQAVAVSVDAQGTLAMGRLQSPSGPEIGGEIMDPPAADSMDPSAIVRRVATENGERPVLITRVWVGVDDKPLKEALRFTDPQSGDDLGTVKITGDIEVPLGGSLGGSAGVPRGSVRDSRGNDLPQLLLTKTVRDREGALVAEYLYGHDEARVFDQGSRGILWMQQSGPKLELVFYAYREMGWTYGPGRRNSTEPIVLQQPALPEPPPQRGGGKVIATYAGNEFTTEDFRREVDRLPERSRLQLTTPERRRQFVDSYILNDLLVQEGRGRGYDKDPEIIKQPVEKHSALIVQRVMKDHQTAVHVSDEEVEGYYKSNQHLFSGEQIRVSHILVKDQALAQSLHDQVVADPDMFSELAKANSIDTATAKLGGDLGVFGQGRMVAEFESVAFSLESPGDISEIVQTMFGYHIIKLTERKKGTPKLFDEVRERVRVAILNRRRQDVMTQQFADLKKRANIVVDDEALASVELAAPN